jgi:hypothetical protein
MRQTKAATIAALLKSSLPPGEGEPSRLDMVAELIAEGYSDSRICSGPRSYLYDQG